MAEGSPRPPTPEELAEQVRQIDVADLLVSTVTTLGQLAYVKLGANERDQARLAIDALAGVIPALDGAIDDQLQRDLKQLLANVRLSFASAAGESGSEPRSSAEPGAAEQEEETQQEQTAEQEQDQEIERDGERDAGGDG